MAVRFRLAGGGLVGLVSRSVALMEFVVARNPDAESSLPFVVKLPLSSGDVVLKVRDTWPRTAKVYCHRVDDGWPTGADLEVVERVTVRSCVRRGVAIDLVLDRARSLAAEHFEAAETDIVLHPEGNGLMVIGTPARSLSWQQLAEHGLADSERELSCGEFYDTDGRNTFPSGCHIAVVDVDTQTGMVRLRRFIAVDDAGVRVNPMIVEGQIHGGIASGVAQVLGEEMTYDADGNPVTSNFADYAIGSIDQFPLFELVGSETATSMNALGFKGVGESGIVGSVPAVHNAVIDALAPLGVRHMDIPCTPHRVWQAIQAASSQLPR